MENLTNILFALMWFAILGGALGLALAFASKVFAVKVDERIPEIQDKLPGANCGGCGYAGCAALAEAIVKGEAKPSACVVGGETVADSVAEIMGVKAEKPVRMRAQVMCSGTAEFAKKKYIYEGAADCLAATKLGGGNKLCPNGCIGLGTCAHICPFGAIKVENGVSAVDYEICQGCGKCVEACPKHIIKLIPYDSKHWVGCMSVDKGAVTRSYCEVGCISCRLCEKTCESGAIHVNDFVASIDYSKCTQCGKCVEKCPRKIIWSDKSQRVVGITLNNEILEEPK
ncbi:MAG: RnfABCDGE type electron transport complex subunit B [Clostridiales bacterium]|nr:RnfABCDGE type electron transport complex subunit B [Clostridiales bacterium]